VKASKGFLLLDLAVVLLLLGTLLLFVLNSFKGCISALARTKEIREAQTLAESTLLAKWWKYLLIGKLLNWSELCKV
jgi:Tfp pilus assembly protein PilE